MLNHNEKCTTAAQSGHLFVLAAQQFISSFDNKLSAALWADHRRMPSDCRTL